MASSDSVALAGLPGTLSPVSLSVPSDLTESKTVEALTLIGRMSKATPWWAADLLVHAEDHFGERVGQIAEALGWKAQTISNLIWVARQVPVSRRREDLAFAHHAEVAALDPDEQSRWLAVAATGDAQDRPWSSRRLRQEIRGPKDTFDEIPCSRCGGSGVEP